MGMFDKRIERIKLWWCNYKGHDWNLIYDKHGTYEEIIGADCDNGSSILPYLPSRHCIFECKKCKITREFRRWAFTEGSGSLTHFVGGMW